MNEHASIRMDAALRQVLRSPMPSMAPRRWRFRHFLRGLRLVQAAQVAAMGVATRPFITEAEALADWPAFGMAAGAAALVALLRPALGGDGLDEDRAPVRAAVAVLSAALLAVPVLLLLRPGSYLMREGLAAWFLGWAALSAGAATVLQMLGARLARRWVVGERVLLFGPPEQAERLARRLAARPQDHWLVSGSVDSRGAAAVEQVLERATATGMDSILVTPGATDAAERLLEQVSDQQLRICLALDLPSSQAWASHGAASASQPVVELVAPGLRGWQATVKRLLDIGLSLAALVVLAPVMAAAALAIRLESPGPVLFRQWRFGLGSRPFMMLKFRTMRMAEGDPTGARRTARHDPRVTRIGRFLRRTSIDELPQLLNILRGDMSLVGPRPHPLHMQVDDAYYFEAVPHYRARHAMRPGLTGWAQVNGARGEVDTLEKARRRLELDLWYIGNWSLALDLRVLLRTAWGGFASPGAD